MVVARRTACSGRLLARAERLVLKPQGEGGGNVYSPSILVVLIPACGGTHSVDRDAAHQGGWEIILCAGVGAGIEEGAHKADVVSELGMSGRALFCEGMVKETESGGWLVRTKRMERDEGGVAVGFSVLDSVPLVGWSTYSENEIRHNIMIL